MKRRNRIILMRNLCTLNDSSSRFLVLKSGTRGLWSVSLVNWRPTRKSEKCSHAHVRASASFSICAKRCSVGVRECELYETGFVSPSVAVVEEQH